MKTTNSEGLDVQWYGVKVLYKYLVETTNKEP
ncbi:hypothetical protein RKD56_004412 [Priestia megaterium]|jgi:hypothetical protein